MAGWVYYPCQNSCSYSQVMPVDPNGNVQLDCSFLTTPFGLSALSYYSCTFASQKQKKKVFWQEITFLSYEFFLGMQQWETSWGLSVCCFYSWISWFIPWINHSQVEKESMFTHIPLVYVHLFLLSSLKMERGFWIFQLCLFHLKHTWKYLSAKLNEIFSEAFLLHADLKVLL